jgi:hypothetical protein
VIFPYDPDFFSRFNQFAVDAFLSALLVIELWRVLQRKLKRPRR